MANPSWVKGVSGNPSGRGKDEFRIKELARTYTAEAMEKLAFWMRSNNPKASVQSAIALIERAWGKPAQTLNTVDEDGKLIPYSIVVMQNKGQEIDTTETIHH